MLELLTATSTVTVEHMFNRYFKSREYLIFAINTDTMPPAATKSVKKEVVRFYSSPVAIALRYRNRRSDCFVNGWNVASPSPRLSRHAHSHAVSDERREGAGEKGTGESGFLGMLSRAL